MRLNRMMKAIILVLAAIGLGCAAPACAEAPAKSERDALFSALRSASDADSAAVIRERLESDLAESGSPTADLLLGRADLLLDHGLGRDALDILRRVTLLAPTWGLSWRREAQAARVVGDSATATRALDRALDLEPRDFWAMIDLAHLSRAAGRERDALDLLRQALDEDPWNDTIRRETEVLARRLGDVGAGGDSGSGGARPGLSTPETLKPGELKPGVAPEDGHKI